MNIKKLFALLLAVLMVVGVFAACGESDPTQPGTQPTQNQGNNPTQGGSKPTQGGVTPVENKYVWKTSVSTLSSNWNPHTYQTSDQSVPLDYTTSSLYTFIFNDELHPVEGKEPFAGYVIIPEMALEMPIDVTEEIKAAANNYGIPESATAGYAYKIVLRDDLCFDDGTPITAYTFEESFKRLLDPRFLNYRAADWYGQSLSLAGAENYFNQGRTTWYMATDLHTVYSEELDSELVFSIGPDQESVSWIRDYVGFPSSYDIAATVEWLTGNFGYPESAENTAKLEGKTLAEIKADAELKAIWDNIIGWWQTEPNEELHFFIAPKTYADGLSFDTVGFKALNDTELLIVLDRSLAGFDLLYNMTSIATQLVKPDLYDACLKKEVGAGGVEVWSSTYGTSVETSVSFGPYKMSSYQTSKAMRFVRNDKWFGYTDGNHTYVSPIDGETYTMYQTDEVYIQVVADSATSKLMFMKGELMSYGLQADDFASLRQSEYCYATPGQTIFFLILNGHMTAIQEREAADDFDTATRDLEMLTNKAFHQALGLAFNKDQFAATVSPARSGGLGIIGVSYIYDPETGARYRDTDQAKKVLCDFYGVDYTKFDNLDDAVATITGYDPTQAKEFLKQAFAEGIEAGYINDVNGDGICDQEIIIEYALSSDSAFMTTTIDYMNEQIAKVADGTPFAGKIKIVKSAPYGDDWSNKIKEGQADTVLGGWSGSLMDPFGLTDLYTNPSKQYDAAWYDSTKVDLTIAVPLDGKVSSEKTEVTMTLKQWSDCLNGTVVELEGVQYNFGSGQADVDIRLDILAAIEGKILESYNYLPMLQDGSMALLSMQVYYVVEEYNPVMGRGGIAYTRYNYNETEWAAYIESQGGELKY